MNKTFLSIAQWKCLLFVMVMVCLGLNVAASFYWERNAVPAKIGLMPVDVGPPDRAYRLPILRLDPGSVLASAGAKVGDTISLDHAGDIRRNLEVGELVGLNWYQANAHQHLFERVVPDPDQKHATLQYVLDRLFSWGCLLLSILIGVRLAKVGVMRALSAMLAFSAANVISDFPAGAFQSFLLQAWVPPELLGAYLTFTYFCLAYPEDASHWRSPIVRRAFYVFALVYVLDSMAMIAENYMVLPPVWRAILQPAKAKLFLASLSVLWSLGAISLSWYRAAGVNKRRLAWVGLCMGGIYATYMAYNLNAILGNPVNYFAIYVYISVVKMVSICALGYALLRYRLFDFGFVINRALAATIISAMLLVVFAVTEFSVDKLLHFEGRQKNIVFDAAVALGIILCFHRIQHWVNYKVDHTFFRSWYEAAEGLRRFLSKTSQITESSALLEKYADALSAFAGTGDVAIFLSRENGSMARVFATSDQPPADLGANHDLLIDLRHARQVMHIDPARSAMLAELALPMMTQGRLRGLVLLGTKPDHQEYRPDELALLGSAAQQLGMDLENLRALELEQQIERLAQLESSLAFVRLQTAAMEQACRAKDEAYRALERETAILRQLLRVEPTPEVT